MQKTNQKLIDAINTFNKIEPAKIPPILIRIFQNDTSNIHILLTEKEKEKFMKVFAVSEPELTNLINALYYFIIQAAFERSFKQVEPQLINAGIAKPQLQALQESWAENGSTYINKIKDKPIAVGKNLEDIKWSLYVPFQDSRLPVKEKFNLATEEEKFKFESMDNLYPNDARNPFLLLNFDLKNIASSVEKENIDTKESFTVKMTKSDIEKVFEQLETIQKNIDGFF